LGQDSHRHAAGGAAACHQAIDDDACRKLVQLTRIQLEGEGRKITSAPVSSPPLDQRRAKTEDGYGLDNNMTAVGFLRRRHREHGGAGLTVGQDRAESDAGLAGLQGNGAGRAWTGEIGRVNGAVI
jgi:hypothetical protein